MTKLRILIADDSVVYRSQIRAALTDFPWAEITGVASNGRLALERIQQVPVDLLILDLEMPEMDGLQTLTEMKKLKIQSKTIVFSSVSKRGSEITLEALRLGASEFVTKPGSGDFESADEKAMEPSARIRSLLEPKILALFPEIEGKSKINSRSVTNLNSNFNNNMWDLFQPKVIVIGSSTGGPTVLEGIFSEITGPLRCPIFITQHMPPIFTATLAERIQKMSGIPTYEAKGQQRVEKNAIYVAPGNFHMSLTGTPDQVSIVLDQGPLQNSVRPAVDPLFASAALIYKDKCLGFVLTGMGADGKIGAEKVKASGGAIIIQEESTCVVFGMPGAVMASGAFDRMLSPAEIISVLLDKTATAKPVKNNLNTIGV